MRGLFLNFDGNKTIFGGPTLCNIDLYIGLHGELGSETSATSGEEPGNLEYPAFSHLILSCLSLSGVNGDRKEMVKVERSLSLGHLLKVQVIELAGANLEAATSTLPESIEEPSLYDETFRSRTDFFAISVRVNSQPPIVAGSPTLHQVHFDLESHKPPTADGYFQFTVMGGAAIPQDGKLWQHIWADNRRLSVGDELTIEIIDTATATAPISSEKIDFPTPGSSEVS